MDTIAHIQIDKLVFPSQEEPALTNIDLRISKGDFIVITGGVASGKSILLHTITGAIPQYHQANLTGKVAIMDQDISTIPLNKMSDYVGYMMQEPQNQLISLNVYDDVAFGLGNLELPMEEIDAIVKSSLDQVGLKGYENRQTSSLSGGEAQRVVLAGVLALGAPILILDQPTAELDPHGRYELYKQLAYLNKTKDLTVILVMDRMEEVLPYANRVLYMKEGQIAREYAPKEYLERRREYLKGGLYKNSPISNAVQSTSDEDPVLKVSNMTYQYKNNSIGCKDINLEIHRGDFLAIVGLNGSGKSTLAKTIIGLLKPTHGEISIFGQKITKKNLNEIRSRCGFLFQNPDYQIFCNTLVEEIGFSLRLRGETKEFIEEKVNESLDFVGLLEYKELHPHRLSRGQRQLLAMSSVLVSEPDFILADEPTSGLDENQGYMIMDKLSELTKNGKTVLLITHDLSMAKYYSNRIVAMKDHTIAFDIQTSDLSKYLKDFKEINLPFINII